MDKDYEYPQDTLIENYNGYSIVERYSCGSKIGYSVYDKNGISRGIPLLSIETAKRWIDVLTGKAYTKHYQVIGKHIVTRNKYGQTFKYDLAPMLNYGKYTLDELMRHITENNITLENGDTITYEL